MKTETIFLSHPISNDIPLYSGSSDINIKKSTSIAEGDTANSLRMSLPNHANTHVDVPYHFFNNGKKITDYDASDWIFSKPKCIDVPSNEGYMITYSDIKNEIEEKDDLLFIRTGYERFRGEKKYWERNPGLSSDLAINLRRKHPNIRALGVDLISITSFLDRKEGRVAHKEFLGGHYDNSDPIVLIEDMSLEQYNTDFKQVIILPLIIQDGDGAPCTIIATK